MWDKFEGKYIYENKFFKGVANMEQKSCSIVSDAYKKPCKVFDFLSLSHILYLKH